MKWQMKKILVGVALASMIGLTACGTNPVSKIIGAKQGNIHYNPTKEVDVNQLSDDYLIGFTGAPSYGDTWDTLSRTLIIKKNHEAVLYLGEWEVGTYEIPEETYRAVSEKLDFGEIGSMTVTNDMDVCDGGSNGILLYDKNNEIYVSRGGFMPQGEKFWFYYKLQNEFVPEEWMNQTSNEFITKAKKTQEDNRQYIETYFPDLEWIYSIVEELTKLQANTIVAHSKVELLDDENMRIIFTDEEENHFEIVFDSHRRYESITNVAEAGEITKQVIHKEDLPILELILPREETYGWSTKIEMNKWSELFGDIYNKEGEEYAYGWDRAIPSAQVEYGAYYLGSEIDQKIMHIYRLEDGGGRCSEFSFSCPELEAYGVVALSFCDNENGVLAYSASKQPTRVLYQTNDGGEHFTKIRELPELTRAIRDLDMLDAKTGICILERIQKDGTSVVDAEDSYAIITHDGWKTYEPLKLAIEEPYDEITQGTIRKCEDSSWLITFHMKLGEKEKNLFFLSEDDWQSWIQLRAEKNPTADKEVEIKKEANQSEDDMNEEQKKQMAEGIAVDNAEGNQTAYDTDAVKIGDYLISIYCPTKLLNYEATTPYGELVHTSYYSTTCEKERNVNILLPAGYSTDKKYPVLYILHGIFGDENSMVGTKTSGICVTIGNMIKEEIAKDMIVVFPYMYASKTQDQCSAIDVENVLAYDNFVNDLVTDLMPFMEQNYSIATGKMNTAITGFSMGGREALAIGLQKPELFGYVGSISSAPGLVSAKDWAMEHPGQFQEKELTFTEEKPSLVMVCCGDSDKTVGTFPKSYHEIFEKNGVDHVWWEIPGSDHGDPAISSGIYNFVKEIF